MSEIIPLREILALHDAALEAYGGPPGIRDQNRLEAALAQPLMGFGDTRFYPTLLKQIAALGWFLCSNHPFVDGNKRVAFAAMAVVLSRNGCVLTSESDDEVQVMLDVASGKMDVNELTNWLERNTSCS